MHTYLFYFILFINLTLFFQASVYIVVEINRQVIFVKFRFYSISMVRNAKSTAQNHNKERIRKSPFQTLIEFYKQDIKFNLPSFLYQCK